MLEAFDQKLAVLLPYKYVDPANYREGSTADPGVVFYTFGSF